MLAWFNAPPPTLILVGDSWLLVQCEGGAKEQRLLQFRELGGRGATKILEGTYFLTPGFNLTLHKMKDWGAQVALS